MRWQTERCIAVLIFCISIHPSTSALKSIVSSLDNLEEVDNALDHAKNSLDDLTSLVSKVFTTEATTEEPTSGLTTLDTTLGTTLGTESSATVSLATMTPPSSGGTEKPKTDTATTTTTITTTTTTTTTTTASYSPSTTTPKTTATIKPPTTTTITTEGIVTTTPEIKTATSSKAPMTPPETTDKPTVKSTVTTTDSIESSTDVNIANFDDLPFGDRVYRVQRSMFISSRKMSPVHFLRDMLVRILPYEFREANEIDQYLGLSENTTIKTDAYGNSTEENTSFSDEMTESETSISTQETTTEPPTTTPGPWGDRVYSVLEDMMIITKEISDGQVDHQHAFDLEKSATTLDNLVIEGSNDTSVLEGMSQEDLDFLNSVKNLINYTREDIKNQINKAKDDRQELIVAISVLSVLFVLVLVGLVVAMIRPWASGFRLPGSKKKMRDTHDETSYISNASFQDRSQQMRLNERRIQGQELSV